jgi:hypothetical protein
MTIKMKNNELFNDGHASDEMLAILSDAMLQEPGQTPNLAEEVLIHVDQCIQCKEKIMDVVTFLRNPDAVADTGDQQRNQEFLHISPPERNRYFYVGKIAAVFVAFAVMVGAYFIIFDGQSPFSHPDAMDSGKLMPSEFSTSINDSKINATVKPEINGPQKKTSSKQKPKVIKDSRYTINPSLENMIGSSLRSGQLEVLEPPNNSILKGKIQFSWKNELTRLHTIKIVNNRNDVLYTHKVSGKGFQFEKSLSNGLYYWKLEDENELLYVGKFFIKR